jgi:CMP-N-acetylneuraminic acid synthetase
MLEVLEKENWYPDVLVLLQPTSPLRLANDIDGAIELQLKSGHKSVVSVSEVSHSPYWSFRIKGGTLVPLFDKRYLKMRRQDLPKTYAPNGAVYVSNPEELRREMSFYTVKTIPYIMPVERSIDIDEEIEFLLAELMMRKLRTSHT